MIVPLSAGDPERCTTANMSRACARRFSRLSVQCLPEHSRCDPEAMPETARKMARVREAAAPCDVGDRDPGEALVFEQRQRPLEAELDQRRAEARAALRHDKMQIAL